MENCEFLEDIISEQNSLFYFYIGNNLNLYHVGDISESGISFYSDKKFKRRESLILYLPIDCEPCLIPSEVVWCNKNQENNNLKNNSKYRVGCGFKGILTEAALDDIAAERRYDTLSKRNLDRRKPKKDLYILVDRVNYKK
jgi:hypothetical protein